MKEHYSERKQFLAVLSAKDTLVSHHKWHLLGWSFDEWKAEVDRISKNLLHTMTLAQLEELYPDV
jgi:hypothetical protein